MRVLSFPNKFSLFAFRFFGLHGFFCSSYATGYKMSRPICRNRLTNADVDDTLCSVTNRPEASVEQCNTHSCPPR